MNNIRPLNSTHYYIPDCESSSLIPKLWKMETRLADFFVGLEHQALLRMIDYYSHLPGFPFSNLLAKSFHTLCNANVKVAGYYNNILCKSYINILQRQLMTTYRYCIPGVVNG